MKFLKFPNNKVWQYEDGHIQGCVRVKGLPKGATDASHEDLAEAITGHSGGITSGFSTDSLGDRLFSFRAPFDVDDFELAYEELEWLTPESTALPLLLSHQYSLNMWEATQAVQSIGKDYGEERVIRMADSTRELRVTRRMPELSYVRITLTGTPFEIAHWTTSQLAEAPTRVMIALFATLESR